MTYEEAVQAIQPGRYRHFKGNTYEVIGYITMAAMVANPSIPTSISFIQVFLRVM